MTTCERGSFLPAVSLASSRNALEATLPVEPPKIPIRQNPLQPRKGITDFPRSVSGETRQRACHSKEAQCYTFPLPE